MTRILILCTGNSCRSQMAEGLLKHFDSGLTVHSAGTEPAEAVHPLAIRVMAEIGIDISRQYPKQVDEFIDQDFDYVITVCDHANETCPLFVGKVKERRHMGFDDPAKAVGSEDEVLSAFRRIRDEMKTAFEAFFQTDIKR